MLCQGCEYHYYSCPSVMLNSCYGPAPEVDGSEKGDPLEELWSSLQGHCMNPQQNNILGKKEQARRQHLLNFKKF